MKILVCGGRDFDSWEIIANTLSSYYEDFLNTAPLDDKFIIIEGGAKGADFLARVWAVLQNSYTNDIEIREYPANWGKFGKQAGFKRNIDMLEKESPDLVVAFSGGNGTAHCIREAKKRGIVVHEHSSNNS